MNDTSSFVRMAELTYTDGFLHLHPNLRDAPTQTGEAVMDICRIGASFVSMGISFRGTLPILGEDLEVYNGAWGFYFSRPKLRHAQKTIREIVTDICGVWASLTGRSYFWHDPPLFFQGSNNDNFIMAPMDTFCFVTPTLRNLPMEKINGMYVSDVGVTRGTDGTVLVSPSHWFVGFVSCIAPSFLYITKSI